MGRAAEDVGPYHPSCPDAVRRAKDSRRPRRGPSGGVCVGGGSRAQASLKTILRVPVRAPC